MTILTSFFCQICGISLTRVKKIRKYWPKVFDSEEEKDIDELCRSKLLINVFNEAYNIIATSYLKVGDESMRAILFWTMSKGNLPHLSYSSCKTEPLRVEFKTVACSITGSLLLVEVKRLN